MAKRRKTRIYKPGKARPENRHQWVQEEDPYGYARTAPGAKLDAGKIRAALVLGDFSRALMAVSEVGTFGAVKYSDHGWLSVPRGDERYRDALLRHYLKDTLESADPESGLSHLAHLAWNALAILELTLRAQDVETSDIRTPGRPGSV